MSFAGPNQQELLFILRMRDEASRVLDQHGRGLRRTGAEAKRTKADLNEMARAVRDVSLAVGALVGAFTTVRRAADDFRAFEKGMATVHAMIPEASSRVAGLSDAVRQMAVESGTSLEVLTGGMFQVISAFGDTADAVDQLRVANEAAIAGLSTTQDAVALLSAVTKAYGDTSGAAQAKVSDLAFMTNKLGETTFPELARSMFNVTGIAATLGVTQEELFGVMATGTGVLGGASEVATSLRQILQSFIVPTEEMTALMRSLGFATGQAMIENLGLIDSLHLVMRTAERSEDGVRKYITGINGINAALTLTGAQSDEWRRKTEAMFDAAGSRLQAYAVMQDTLDGSLRRLSASLEGLRVDFGAGLAPALIETARQLTGLIEAFQKLEPETREAMVRAAALTGGLLTLAVAVRGLITAFRLLGGSLLATPWGIAIGAATLLGASLQVLSGANDSVARATRMHRDELDQIRRSLGDATDASDQLTESLKERARLTLTAELREAEANAAALFRLLDRASFQGLFDDFAHLPLSIGRQFNELREQFRAGALSATDYGDAVAGLGNQLEAQSPRAARYARGLLEQIEALEAAELAAENARQALDDLATGTASRPRSTEGPRPPAPPAAVPEDPAAARRAADFVRDITRQTELLQSETLALRAGEQAYLDWQRAREIEGPVQAFLDRAVDLELEQGLVERLTQAWREQATARQEAQLAAEAETASDELRRQIELLEEEAAALRDGSEAHAEWQRMRAIEAPLEQFARMAEGLRMEQDAVEQLTEAYREAARTKQAAAEEAEAAAETSRQARQLSDDLATAFTNTARDMLLQARSLDEALANLAMRLAEVLVQAAVLGPMQAALSGAIMGIFTAAEGRAFMGGEVVPMARGGTGSGGILKTPTLFPMRGGKMALGGELEDEAILPLTRLPNGDLGVQALGGGGGAMVLNVNTSVTVEGGSRGPQADHDLAERLGRQVEQAVDAAMTRTLRQQMRAGNLLNPVVGR